MSDNNNLTQGIVADEIRELGFRILTNVVFSTPVDKGVARNNWIVTFDTPSTDTIVGTDRGGAGAIRREGRKILDLDAKDIPGSIFISNNLPYIERLNEGWSAQAPAKFVDSAIQRAVDNG